jgi:hypothetical protein
VDLTVFPEGFIQPHPAHLSVYDHGNIRIKVFPFTKMVPDTGINVFQVDQGLADGIPRDPDDSLISGQVAQVRGNPENRHV